MNQFQLLKALMSNSSDNPEREKDYMEDQYNLPLDQRIQDIKGMARNPQYKEIPVMEKEEGASSDIWYAPDELVAGAIAPGIQQGLKKGAPVAFRALKSMAQDAPGILANEVGMAGKRSLEQWAENAAIKNVAAENAQGAFGRGDKNLEIAAKRAFRRWSEEADKVGLTTQEKINLYGKYYKKHFPSSSD